MVKLLTALFVIIGMLAVAAGGYWWGVDRPGWSWGPCPLCVRLEPGAGVKLATLEAAEAKAAQRAALVTAGATSITQAASANQAQVQSKIKIVYRDIIKEIPNVITPEIDKSFPLSVGFVRMHDAAANGFKLSDISHSATQSDDSASSIKSSNAATIIATNYEKCTADDAQLNGLIKWIQDQETNGSITVHP